MLSPVIYLPVLAFLGGVGGGMWLGRRIARKAKGDLPPVDAALVARLDAASRANVELRQALEEMERAAGTDRLTGAWNRRRFEEGAHALMAFANRKRDPLCAILFDLDHFKQVNDTHGHRVGDAVLVAVSQVAREQARASDFLVRWGGEEFLILAPGTAVDGAVAMAEKVRRGVAQTGIPPVGHITVSLGVAEYSFGESILDWIQRADQALYQAKAQGRNRTIAAPSPTPSGAPGTAPLLELVWDIAYESGHPAMDAQHRQLFELSNALFSTATSSQDSGEIRLRLKMLIAHVAQHFHEEEALMEAHGFPGLGAHIGEHTRLLAVAQQLQEEHPQDVGRLLAFLALDLIKGHLLGRDREYFGCFNSSEPAPGNPQAPAL